MLTGIGFRTANPSNSGNMSIYYECSYNQEVDLWFWARNYCEHGEVLDLHSQNCTTRFCDKMDSRGERWIGPYDMQINKTCEDGQLGKSKDNTLPIQYKGSSHQGALQYKVPSFIFL